MQDWDRLIMLMLGAGVAIYTAREGWRSWRAANRKAAVGAALLAAASVVLPIALIAFGG